ncbi:hemicentin-2-like [Liolophura sinensis]|uniref:hemicentin-2-like n=1 Tax=Liolophura sinensis TaxID=3198878 RepID=UPI003158927F
MNGKEGESMVLKCEGSIAGNDVTWHWSNHLKRNVIATMLVNGDVKYSAHSSQYNRNITMDGDGSLHILRLDYKLHNGSFRCDNGGLSTEVELTVYPSPTKLTLSNTFTKGGNLFLNVTKGKPLPVLCKSDSSFPEFNFTWTLNDCVLNRSHGAQSAVTLKVEEYHNGSILECKVRYPQGAKTEQTILNVLYISPSVQSSISVSENRSVDLRCNITGNPPPSFSWWRMHGDQSERLPENSAIYSVVSVNRSQAGTYECRGRNDAGNRTVSVEMIVEYPPVASVFYNNGLQALECSVDGMPRKFYFRPWEQRLGEVTLSLIPGERQDENIYRLFLPENCNTMGLYVCIVGNTHGTARGEFFHRPNCKPLIGDGAFRKCISNKTSIAVPFYAYPNFTNTLWQTDSGETTHVNTTLEEMENVIVEMTVRGTVRKATILGQAVVWDFPDGLSDSFTLTVTNSVGSSSVRLTLCEVPSETDGGLGPLKTAAIVSAVLVVVFLIIVCLYVFRQKTKGKTKIQSNLLR